MGKAKVLYIEDNSDNMMLVRRVLMVEGYEIIEAENGTEGLEKATSDTPDIILTDINLPDIDGYEITKQLKKDETTAHIPIVAMTANATPKQQGEVFEAGCDGLITKPIDIDKLPEQIEHYLKGKSS